MQSFKLKGLNCRIAKPDAVNFIKPSSRVSERDRQRVHWRLASALQQPDCLASLDVMPVGENEIGPAVTSLAITDRMLLLSSQDLQRKL
jgi:hypothetical protein